MQEGEASWTFLDSHVDEREYTSYSSMTDNKSQAKRHKQPGVAEVQMRQSHHGNLVDSGRRNTTNLDVLTTLAPLGLCRLLIPGDGACMFRAASHYMYGTGTRHQEIRENCVREIIKRKEEFLPFIQGEEGEEFTIGQYCKKMIQTQSWGGNIELQAISHYYKRKIIIYAFNKTPMLTLGDEYCEVLLMWYSHGNHYDCVYPQIQMDTMAECQSIVTNLIGMLFDEAWEPPDGKAKAEYQNYDYIYWKKEMEEQERQDNKAAMHLLLDDVHEKNREDEEEMNREYAMRLQREEDENERNLIIAQQQQNYTHHRKQQYVVADEDSHRQRKHPHNPKEDVAKAIRGVGRFLKKKSPRGPKEPESH